MDKNRDVNDASELARLGDLDGFQVAAGDHDIRGWEVRTPDDAKIGKVEELIVDLAERRVRYLEVKADGKVLGVDDDRYILIPIGAARLREDGNDVLIERLPAQGLAGVPLYERGEITREYESSLRAYYGATTADVPADYYRDELYDDSRLRGDATRHTEGVDTTNLPRLGDNEVTVPLVGDQEVIIRQPGSNEEIVIRKSTAPKDEEIRDR
ncbi:MAG: PRC-barrel domain-containing protein [Gemmatimonadaceae bacterium]